MADFLWFSDEKRAQIEPLLPTDMRGMPRVDDRRVLSGIVHPPFGCRSFRRSRRSARRKICP